MPFDVLEVWILEREKKSNMLSLLGDQQTFKLPKITQRY